MANIGPVPINMNRSVLKIGTDNYEKSVNKCILKPQTPVASFKGIGGSTTVTAGEPVWTLDFTYAQDWTTPDSLSLYLMANIGTVKTIELTPETGGQKATVSVLIIPGDMGGDVDTTTVASVSLAVIGQPTFAA